MAAAVGLQNSRKALKFGRRQRNAAVAGVANVGVGGRDGVALASPSQGGSRCLRSVKYKHVWLLPLFREPANHPFNRSVCQLQLLLPDGGKHSC